MLMFKIQGNMEENGMFISKQNETIQQQSTTNVDELMEVVKTTINNIEMENVGSLMRFNGHLEVISTELYTVRKIIQDVKTIFVILSTY